MQSLGDIPWSFCPAPSPPNHFCAERAGALGRLGVSYGVGMVVGPVIGGYVSTYFGEQSAAGIAAVLCLVPIAIVVVFVPGNTKREPQAASNGSDGAFFVRVSRPSFTHANLPQLLCLCAC